MADRNYFWLRRVYEPTEGDPGVVNLTEGPVLAPATIERIVLHVQGTIPFPRINDSLELVWRSWHIQAIEVTRSTLPNPPPLPPPLDFQAGMGSRDFLWTGSMKPGFFSPFLRWLIIPRESTQTIDTSQRRTPGALEAVQLWWQWASNAPHPDRNVDWALWSNVLLSEPA